MPDKTKNQVALFTTCMVDQLFPEVAVAAVRLLRRSGFSVIYPEEQTCCGQPFSNSGFRAEARKLARQTIQTLLPYQAVVVLGGSCTGMLRVEYPQLFEDDADWLARARQLAAKTFELSEFLNARVVLKPKRTTTQSVTVTYHDSCHMLRVIGLKQQPRTLLEQVGCQIIEMADSERCCGFGGLFTVRMHEVSQAITDGKLERAFATGAQVLVTADPGCLMQMRSAQAEGSPTRIAHLAEVLEELAA
ncbi:MAG TPA: (Fe-S)-binding protein [Anaerolineales bacterium]|nr:(Fe-S)-binding protein [Anaerolineales bacterium]